MISPLIHTTKDNSLVIECREGEISIKGKSILSDPFAFFKPVSEWLDEYIKQSPGKTTITLLFTYIDTASVQAVFDLLKKMKQIPDAENKLHVKWYFEFDDPELLEIGEIMEARLKLKFDYVEHNLDQN